MSAASRIIPSTRRAVSLHLAVRPAAALELLLQQLRSPNNLRSYSAECRYLGQLLEGEEALHAMQRGVNVLQSAIDDEVSFVAVPSCTP